SYVRPSGNAQNRPLLERSKQFEKITSSRLPGRAGHLIRPPGSICFNACAELPALFDSKRPLALTSRRPACSCNVRCCYPTAAAMRNKGGSFTPRGSRAARGARGSLRGRGRHANGPSPFSPGPGVPSSLNLAGFTLADEARQTSQHDHSVWGQDSSLRSKPVLFLSAGKSEPLRDFNKAPPQGQPEDGQSIHIYEQQHGDAARHTDGHPSDIGGFDDAHVIGPEELDKAIEEATQGSGQPGAQNTLSFFFDVTGQKSNKKSHKTPVQVPERHFSPEASSSDEIILFRGRNRNPQVHRSAAVTSTPGRTEVQANEQQTPEILAKPGHRPQSPGIRLAIRSRPPDRGRRSRRGRDHNRVRGQANTSDDDSMLADYIANMRANGEIDETLRQYIHNRRDLGGTESDVSDDSPRPTKAKGHGNLRRASDPNADTGDKASAHSSDDSDGEKCTTESEVGDETLSKLTAGQNPRPGPDVGRGDATSSDSDSSSDEGEHGLGQMSDHDDFDVMNWERPSLRRKKGKASRAQIKFDGCDSETEQQLQAACKSDRLKKKQRRKQREELRALGLLGQKTSPDDLRVKYPIGMTIQEVAAEVRAFLTGINEILSFPPMDLHARKAIHDLANKFNIKSKSTGKADQRRPTLYRTGRTLPYVESTFQQAVARIQRPYLPRMDGKKKRGPNQTPAARGSYAAASYLDGEIVGAAAPELGTENRGRTMLEKMGWSSGTALGATHNKGILEPVTHAMKRSKAGLG
ncbi:Protein SQS1, partial [Tolypocladium ophioglossoides CBS 100239]